MTKLLRPLALFYISLTISGCESTTASRYFGKPIINSCITMFEAGKMACNGKVYPIPPKMVVPMSQGDYLEAQKYYSDKEYRLFICLKYQDCN